MKVPPTRRKRGKAIMLQSYCTGKTLEHTRTKKKQQPVDRTARLKLIRSVWEYSKYQEVRVHGGVAVFHMIVWTDKEFSAPVLLAVQLLTIDQSHPTPHNACNHNMNWLACNSKVHCPNQLYSALNLLFLLLIIIRPRHSIRHANFTPA